jgi:hypothetical protein
MAKSISVAEADMETIAPGISARVTSPLAAVTVTGKAATVVGGAEVVTSVVVVDGLAPVVVVVVVALWAQATTSTRIR